MDLERLLVEATRVELQVDEYFVPDCELPEDYQGPHLVAIACAGRLAALTSAGRLVRPFAPGAAGALLEALTCARQETVHEGMDTACGRTLTTLRFRVDHARGPSHSFSLQGTINHLVPAALPPHWSAALCLLRDAAGALGGGAEDAWDRALTWAAPVDLGAAWRAGSVVRVPHRVTAVEHDGTLYLRTGQPPGPSSLYRVSADSLIHVDVDRAVAPGKDGHRAWALPCGGGTVVVHQEWQRPPRFVICAADERGIYVQRA